MSAKQIPGGTVTFMGTMTFRHNESYPDRAKAMTGLGIGQRKQDDEQREMVAVLAALSLLNKTKLLEKANAYMVGKLKERLQGFNRQKNEWRKNQRKEEESTK